MTCSKCSANYESHDSLGSTIGLCEDCWEDQISESWWRMIDAITEQKIREEGT